jgi:hypothetical protein
MDAHLPEPLSLRLRVLLHKIVRTRFGRRPVSSRLTLYGYSGGSLETKDHGTSCSAKVMSRVRLAGCGSFAKIRLM